MTLPSIERTKAMDEMVETFADAYFRSPAITPKAMWKAGLRAVIEKHIGPMIAEAFAAGRNSGFGNFDRNTYADRIISDLTANPPAPEKERT